VERIILEEIARIQESGPTEEERRLAVTKFEAQHAFDTETSEASPTLWPRRDHLDARRRAALRGPARRITREQIGTRRAGISLPYRLRAAGLRAEARYAMRRGRALVVAGSSRCSPRPRGSEPTVGRPRLPTGSPCWCARTRPRRSFGVSLMVRMGTRWETVDNAGISNLVQLWIVRGTTRATAADRRGGRRDGRQHRGTGDVDTPRSRPPRSRATGWRYWSWWPTWPSAHDAGRRGGGGARLPPRQVRQSRPQALRRGPRRLTARVFGRHPYAWDPLGLRPSLERLDATRSWPHYQRHYVPGGLVLA